MSDQPTSRLWRDRRSRASRRACRAGATWSRLGRRLLVLLGKLLLAREEGLLLLLVRRALARVVVADARPEGAARHPHEADVVGRVELACVGAAVEERDWRCGTGA